MKRVLVTGATGFIGRQALAPLHARGFEVHAALVPGQDSIDERVQWHTIDLLADDVHTLLATIAPTHLLHLAWYAVPGKYWTARENVAWLRASLALYEAFVAAGGKRVVMAGTSAEYDWSAGGVCKELDTPLRPKTLYGICKRALGDVITADGATSSAWARFFFLYGPHEYPQRLVSSVILSLLRGETARCSPGTQRRDFLHVADAAAATVALLDSDVRGPVNIGTGNAVTVRSLVEKIASLLEGQVAFGALPPDDPPLVVADIQRLRDEVGFSTDVDLDARVRETVDWWRSNKP